MYTVIVEFADLQDGKHLYHGGDTFPRDGYMPDKDRIAELLGSNNLMHKPLIVKQEKSIISENQKVSRKRKTRR